MEELRYIKHEDIDKKKWDSCIHFSINGLPYAYYWYLKNVCEEWDAIVEGDYESVMPLCWNKRILGYQQIYQPFFCQQLGVFSMHILSQKRITKMLEMIPEHFRYINIHLNDRNNLANSGIELPKKDNYILPLFDDYDSLYKKFSSNTKRSIKKARKSNLYLTTSLKPEALVSNFRKHQGPKISVYTDATYHSLHRIIYNALHRGIGRLNGVFNEANEMIAGGFFLFSHNRIINLLPYSNQEGRDKCAMHFLINNIIQSSAGSRVLLDFEGSGVESIARFYKGFGSESKPYYLYKKNTLPTLLKLIKK